MHLHLLLSFLDTCLLAHRPQLEQQRFEPLSDQWRAFTSCCCACAAAVPGVFSFLGIQNETAGSVHGLHTAQFQMDEGQLPAGAALHATFALEFLARHGAGSGVGRDEL